MTNQVTGEQSFALHTIPAGQALPRWGQLWVDELARISDRSGRPARANAADLRSRLVRILACREAAVARTTDGCAFAGVRRVAHPLTGARETSVIRFAATADTAADLLLAELDRRGLLDRCSTEVEAAPDSRHGALARHGFAERVLTVWYDSAGAGPAPIPADVDVHPLRPAETGFVLECLAIALRRGLGGEQAAVDLTAWAKDQYPLGGHGELCLVGTCAGRPVCHGLGYSRPDRYGTGRVLYLVDVFVVPEYQGRGLSRLVTAAMMRRATETGYRVVESDVMLSPGSDGLRVGLRNAGWAEDRVRWSRG